MIKNNNVAQDTQGERIERLALLSANIGVYGPLIGIPAPKIAMAETAFDDYVGAVAEAGVQDGQMDEAYETYNKAVEATAKFYALVRAHLQEIIWEFDKPDDFLHAYGFEGDSPTWYKGLVPKIEQWEKNHALLVAAADPRVIPDAVLAELSAKRDNMVSLQVIAFAEGRESSEAYDALHVLFDAHTKLLRFILTGAQLVWGDEDPRLVELGFQTASGIWTEGEPEPGQAEWPDAVLDFNGVLILIPIKLINLKWALLFGATTYNLYRTVAPIGSPDMIRPDAPWKTGLTEPLLGDMDIEPGYVYVYWVVGLNEDLEQGEFCEPIVVEYPI